MKRTWLLLGLLAAVSVGLAIVLISGLSLGDETGQPLGVPAVSVVPGPSSTPSPSPTGGPAVVSDPPPVQVDLDDHGGHGGDDGSDDDNSGHGSSDD